jgi:general secretion pathway protein K
MRRRGEDGFAIVAAVAALAVFAAVAFAVLAYARGAARDLQARYAQARLDAAADAGLVLAVQGLAVDDPGQRWAIGGAPRVAVFEGVKLTIGLEDERSKVPMPELEEDQVRRLFHAAGAQGDQLDTLTDAYLDWMDDDSEPRPHGAEAADYAAQGIHPRDGAPPTPDELARLKGMTPELFARIRPSLTSFFGVSGAFNPKGASPLALAVLSAGGENGVEVIEREREEEGERPATEIAPQDKLAGRNLTVVVRAEDGQGGALLRRTVIVMTGLTAPVYYVREMR